MYSRVRSQSKRTDPTHQYNTRCGTNMYYCPLHIPSFVLIRHAFCTVREFFVTSKLRTSSPTATDSIGFVDPSAITTGVPGGVL